ncbi:MAG TPA: cytochrome b/b6 domain-containing protein [Dehalococcoidales bacterium]|nr:cytochrome b/b6 domain-containing protein [Dehalococcoidales bacterium]
MATVPVEEAMAGEGEPEYFVRFNLGQRIEHVVLMVTFIVLSVTGLAQRFYTAGWAQWVILGLGGIEYTRLVHRIFAVVFILSIIYHLGYIINALFRRHARPDMVPTFKDFRDVVATLRYSFGFTDRKPQFGRFDYRQKFEYWGIIFGSGVIIASGFFLMYPVAVTRIFPGQFVAAAKEFHGNEAMLAVLTIVVWHLYDVMFKPGIFPSDTSIFSGKISKERLMEEHTLEYAELTGEKAAGETAPATTAPPAEPPPSSPAG